MKKNLRIFLVVTFSIFEVISCQKSPQLNHSESQVTGSFACPARTPLPQLYSQMRAMPKPVQPLTPPRSQPQGSEELVQRTQDLPAVFSKESTLFGVEVELPATADLQRDYAKMLLEVVINDKLKKCNIGLTSWKWQQGKRFTLTDEKRNPKTININIGTDPAVVEISTTPLTYGQTESWQDILEDLIFATSRDLEKAKYLGSPDKERNRWSGHLNISWPGLMTSMGYHEPYSRTTFQRMSLAPAEIERQNMNLLLNLFVDLQNHPQLAMGILGGDTRNATPLVFGNESEQKTLTDTIRAYEGNQVTNLAQLASKLVKAHPESSPGTFGHTHYSLLSTEGLTIPDYSWGYVRGTRLEIRGFFSPTSMASILSNYRLMNARLAYLYENFTLNGKVLAYRPPKMDPNFLKNINRNNFIVHGLSGNLNPIEAADVYIDYISQTGLNPLNESQYLRDPIVKAAVQNRLQCR